MRIKKIGITRYGPLPAMELDVGRGIQPLYGPNESGKTLLIDAVVKMLTGRSGNLPESLDRVEEKPEGYLVLEDDGKEIKLEGNQTLSDHLDVDPDELMNVFVVRDSNLRISKEDVFYEQVTDKITGLKVNDIRKVKEALREHGKLTETGKISDSSTSYHAKTQLSNARELEKDVSDYLDRAEREGVRELEAEILETKSKKTRLQERANNLEEARKKASYNDLKHAYQDSNSVLSQLEEIPEEAPSLQERLTLLEAKETDLAELRRRESVYRRLLYIILPSSAAAFISTAVLGVTGVAGILVPTGLILLWFMSLFLWASANHGLSSFEEDRKSLLRNAQEAGVVVNNVGDLRSALGEIGKKRRKLEEQLNQKLGVLKSGLGIDFEGPEKILKACSEKLDEKREEVKFDIDLEYDEGLRESTHNQLKEEESRLKTLRESHEKHRQKQGELLRRARNLDFKVFLGEGLEVDRENLESLRHVKKRLGDFTELIEEDARLSRQALSLFEELDSEEHARIGELFGKGNPVSGILTKITGGRYQEAVYDTDSGKIVVRRDSGQELPVEKLSKGTRDQLYLAVRVALGKWLLKGNPGFFIMDDAFLSSDSERLEREVEMLESLSEMGWQVIYSTTKSEVIGGLHGITDNPVIEFKALP